MAEALRTRHGLTVFTMSELTDLPLEEGMFDVVTLWHALEHVLHPAEMISQIARLLRPGGHVIVEVPNLESWQAGIRAWTLVPSGRAAPPDSISPPRLWQACWRKVACALGHRAHSRLSRASTACGRRY